MDVESILPGPDDVAPPEFEDPSVPEGGVDDTMYDDASEGPSEGPPEPQRRQRRRGRGPDYAQQPAPRNPLPWQDSSLEWDSWCNAFGWDRDSTLKFILRRISPERWGSAAIGGVIETREKSPFLLSEIQSTYGGGEYEGTITGTHPHHRDGRPRLLSRKRIRIAGDPIVNGAAVPRSTLYDPRNAAAFRAADPTAKALDIVQGELQAMRNGNESPKLVEKTMAVVQQSAESRAQLAEQNARERIKNAEDQLTVERKKTIDLEQRLRGLETDMMKNNVENQARLTEVANSSQASSLQAIMSLLPQFSGSANEQVRQMTALYGAREERLAAEYKTAVQQERANAAAQAQAQQTLFHAQVETMKGQYENTISLLQHELQAERTKVASLERRVDELRTQLDTKAQELITHVVGSKAKSPTEQFSEMASVFEAVESMRSFLGAGGKAEEDDGIENPLHRKLLTMGEGVVQNLPAILQTLRSGGAGTAPPQMAMAPMPGPQFVQQMPQQMPRQAPAPAGAAPRLPLPPPPPPTPGPKLRPSEIAEALEFVEGVLASNPNSPPPVDDVAKLAVMHAPNDVLRVLTSRPPERVIAQIESKGLLKGVLLEDVGKKYLHDLLIALKTQLGPAPAPVPK